MITLTGIIIDKDTRRPISGVHVFESDADGNNKHNNRITVSDSKGYFHLMLPQGTAYVAFSHITYGGKVLDLQSAKMQKPQINLQVDMQEKTTSLPDVIVSPGTPDAPTLNTAGVGNWLKKNWGVVASVAAGALLFSGPRKSEIEKAASK